MRHEAIRKLYPQVVVIQDEIGCFDNANNLVDIDDLLVEQQIQLLKTQYDSKEYARNRVAEYPLLQDLADAIYWQNKGDSSKMQAYLAACEAVKNKYPRGV